MLHPIFFPQLNEIPTYHNVIVMSTLLTYIGLQCYTATMSPESEAQRDEYWKVLYKYPEYIAFITDVGQHGPEPIEEAFDDLYNDLRDEVYEIEHGR